MSRQHSSMSVIHIYLLRCERYKEIRASFMGSEILKHYNLKTGIRYGESTWSCKNTLQTSRASINYNVSASDISPGALT